jgi:hypothetical protein
MIRYKYIFGPYIPMNEARIWLQSWTLQVRTYFFIFAVIAALCHPSQQISKASVLSQFAFWTIGYFIFLLVYPFVQLLCVKLTLALQCFTLFISIPLGISNCIIGSIMYFLCPFLGISVDDHYDVLKFYIFNAVLFEIGAYCYIAYVDRAIFPEIYLDEFGDSARNDTSRLRTHSQNNTIAASAQADRKISGRRSNRMATLRQSLMRPNIFSIL